MGHVSSPGPLSAGEQNRDDVECLIACPLVDGDLEFLLLPRPQTIRPQEHNTGFAPV
jgi:hypothetical protein